MRTNYVESVIEMVTSSGDPILRGITLGDIKAAALLMRKHEMEIDLDVAIRVLRSQCGYYLDDLAVAEAAQPDFMKACEGQHLDAFTIEKIARDIACSAIAKWTREGMEVISTPDDTRYYVFNSAALNS